MSNIYIGFSDSFVADKFLKYLKNSFENISLLNSSISIPNQSVVISDFDFFSNSCQILKNTNVILLVEVEKKTHILQNNFLSLNILELPIKMQDLIDIIEQIKTSIANVYAYNGWYLDLNNNILYKYEITLNLSEKEALILKEFFINNDQSITKEQFMKNVWNISNTEIESQSLESYISTLRRKFADNNIGLVITKNKDGYSLS